MLDPNRGPKFTSILSLNQEDELGGPLDKSRVHVSFGRVRGRLVALTELESRCLCRSYTVSARTFAPAD
jgi:hypothetical protein